MQLHENETKDRGNAVQNENKRPTIGRIDTVYFFDASLVSNQTSWKKMIEVWDLTKIGY